MPEDTMKMLINVEEDETRIALVREKQLDNLFIEQNQRTQNVGNIYCGVVTKVQPSFQAAFVDYGADRNGFLAASDLNPKLFKDSKGLKGRPNITQLLRNGDKVLVQVLKDEIGHKGASLTTNLSLPGRFMVFMPDSDKGGVSKKIEDSAHRERLKHLLKGLDNEDAGVIIRTAGVGRSLDELKRDYMNLRRVWKRIEESYEKRNKPGLLYEEEGAVVRMLRDYFNDKISEVIIDDPNAFQQALEFFQANMPADQKRLHLYLGERSLFSAHGIESQIGALNSHKVPLPSGGSLVISPTEALVAIDVNSGRSTQERNIEETAVRTNLEAADEVARQLRLRNLGGLVVIDFIDMDSAKNRQLVVSQMEDALVDDKARWALGEISRFGLLEMSRQRIASSLSTNSPTVSIANRIVRRIQDLCAEHTIQEIRCSLIPELAVHLLNAKRRRLHQLEVDFGVSIQIIPDPLQDPDEVPDMEVLIEKDGDPQTSIFSAWEVEIEDDRSRRRRRRRRRPENETSSDATDAPEAEDTSAEENDAPVTPEADSSEEEDAKPARRRRRGRRRSSSEETSEASTEDDVSSDTPDAEAEVDSDVEPEAAEAPEEPEAPVAVPVAAPRPAARAKRKPFDGVLFSSIHEGVIDDGLPWAPPPIPEWRRRNQEAPINRIIFSSTHLPTGEESEEDLPVAPTEAANSAVTAEPVAEEAPKKPKRAPRARKKASDEPQEAVSAPEAEASVTETAASDSAEEAVAEEKPKKKPASRTRSRAKKAETADASEQTAKTAETAEAEAPAKPKSPRKSRAKAATEEAADASEAKPKATRSRAKKAAAPADAADGAEAPAEATEPKATKPRRRSPAKKTQEPETVAPESSER